VTWLLGVLGNLAFAYACVPTAWRTWRAKRSIGTPIGLAWNIMTACLLFYSYVLLAHGYDLLVAICGAVEVLSYLVVIWFNYFPWFTAPESELDRVGRELATMTALYERERADYMAFASIGCENPWFSTITEIKAMCPAGIVVDESVPGTLRLYAACTLEEVREARREYDRRYYCPHRNKGETICLKNHVHGE
jgi:hypothetical protein